MEQCMFDNEFLWLHVYNASMQKIKKWRSVFVKELVLLKLALSNWWIKIELWGVQKLIVWIR